MWRSRARTCARARARMRVRVRGVRACARAWHACGRMFRGSSLLDASNVLVSTHLFFGCELSEGSEKSPKHRHYCYDGFGVF